VELFEVADFFMGDFVAFFAGLFVTGFLAMKIFICLAFN